MISPETEAEILRLFHAEKWTLGTIAAQLGLHHSAVARVVENEGVPRPKSIRRSIVTGYLPFLRETLEKYPRLTAARLYVMCRERGYPGRPDHFRHLVAGIRPRPPAEAYLRLRTLPGEQGQVDWGHFGKVQVGEQGLRPLLAFVIVLSFSRRIFLRFYLGQHMENFLRGHVEAFCDWNGCPRVLLYDNLKSAVLERVGDAIRFNPTLLQLAGHYRFEGRPVAVARGNEKGRVERAIRYIREGFFAARKWRDLGELNAQALAWCHGESSDRRWPEDPGSKTVREAFEEERTRLLELPGEPFPTDERREVNVGKTPYVRFDKNDYSIPHCLVRRSVCIVANERTVRILSEGEVVAEHARSYDRRQQIEDPRHIEALVEEKSRARKHRAMDRLSAVCPSSRAILAELASQDENLGSATRQLVRLLETYGADRLERAMKTALLRESVHPQSIRYLLEREREEEGKPPLLPLDLRNPRLREIVVKPHELSSYDVLGAADSGGAVETENKQEEGEE